jgi:hypothetical protein
MIVHQDDDLGPARSRFGGLEAPVEVVLKPLVKNPHQAFRPRNCYSSQESGDAVALMHALRISHRPDVQLMACSGSYEPAGSSRTVSPGTYVRPVRARAAPRRRSLSAPALRGVATLRLPFSCSFALMSASRRVSILSAIAIGFRGRLMLEGWLMSKQVQWSCLAAAPGSSTARTGLRYSARGVRL